MFLNSDRPGLFALAYAGPLSTERLAFYLRLALAIAILSVAFEIVMDLEGNLQFKRYHLVAPTIGLVLSCILVLFERTSRVGVGLFAVSIFVYVAAKWAAFYNHGYLAAWTIPVAIAFGEAWWKSEIYRWYLRATLGIVMLAACAQKLLAGTYLDGSFITYLSLYGSTTERMFGFLCGPDVVNNSCLWHQFLGTFIVIWQAVVGILLLIGVRSLLFLFVEITSLLGAGLYADEMNFQVLNIALLCIAFGYGMRPWLCMICVPLLFIDAYSISGLIDHVL